MLAKYRNMLVAKGDRVTDTQWHEDGLDQGMLRGLLRVCACPGEKRATVRGPSIWWQWSGGSYEALHDISCLGVF